MSTPKFTPGPWRLDDKAGNITRHIVGADGSEVCSVWNVRHHLLKDPRPDTNLILAAPELYEALLWIVGNSDLTSEVNAVARRALAKVRDQ